MNKGHTRVGTDALSVYKTGDVVILPCDKNPGNGWVESGSVLTSANLQDLKPLATSFEIWASRTSLGTSAVNKIVYNNGLWLALQENALYGLKSSTDTISWTTREVPYQALSKIVYGGGTWVAGGTANAYSTDGINWTTGSADTAISALGYANSLWVGGSANIQTSTDGIRWLPEPVLNSHSSSVAYKIRYLNNAWAMVGRAGSSGEGNNFLTSTDGVSWISRNTLSPTAGIYSVDYGNGLWMVTGDNSVIRTSTDTVNWVTQTAPIRTSCSVFCAYGNSLWVIGGFDLGTQTGFIRSSTDAVNWVTREAFYPAGNPVNGVKYLNNKWWAVGGGVRSSTDGISWTTVMGQGSTIYYYDIAYANNTWVLGGGFWGGLSALIKSSTDSINWTTANSYYSGANAYINSVAYGNGLWAAVGTTAGLRTSTDAINWVTGNPQYPSASSNILSIDYNVSKGWMLCGEQGYYKNSTDAIVWYPQRPFGMSAALVARTITYGAGKWVIGGSQSSMAVSTDGFSWTTVEPYLGTASVTSVVYGNGLWAAMSTTRTTIRTSTDAISWTTQALSAAITSIASLEYFNKRFVIGGASGLFITSTDLKTWQPQTLPSTFASESVSSIAYGNDLWVAGGGTGNLAVSGLVDVGTRLPKIGTIPGYKFWIKT